jgi:tetratricopeptide (TPR) repeat protein
VPRTPTTTVDELLELGLERARQRHFDEAIGVYRQAVEKWPDDPRAAMLLGSQLSEIGEYDEAVEHLQRAAELTGPLTTQTTGVYNNLANALRRAKRYDEAEPLLRELTRIAPKEWPQWHNLGQLLRDTDRCDEAAAALRRAVALNPDFGPNHAMLGAVLHSLGRLHSADASFHRALAIGYDNDVNMFTLMGNNYRYLGLREPALDVLQRALALAPEAPHTHNNIGLLHMHLGEFDLALAEIDKALEIEPDNHTWYANRGYTRLTAGDIPGGWDDWEHALEGGSRGSERPTDAKRWTPEHTDTRVLCYREQGVGDEILFASLYPELIATARDVIIECEDRLVPLFTRSFPGATVRKQTYVKGLGQVAFDFDHAISAGSLSMHFRPTVDAFPKDRASFLVADPERVAFWRSRFAEFGPGAVAGMSWRSKVKTAERRLEYTRLADDWGPLFSVPGVHWVNLQYDDCERELRDAEKQYGVTIHRWDDVDYMNDFDEVAAIMCACDLVVAPRNAVAMLSGALGVPTVMMGNRWDWSDLGTDTSPWFPTVQLVYRHFGEEWEPVIAAAAARVASVAGEKGTS